MASCRSLSQGMLLLSAGQKLTLVSAQNCEGAKHEVADAAGDVNERSFLYRNRVSGGTSIRFSRLTLPSDNPDATARGNPSDLTRRTIGARKPDMM